jgi:hypothetical protein
LNVGGSRASYARCVLPILAPRSDYVGLAPLPEHHGCWPKGNDDLLSNEKIVHAKVTVGYSHALAEHLSQGSSCITPRGLMRFDGRHRVAQFDSKS